MLSPRRRIITLCTILLTGACQGAGDSTVTSAVPTAPTAPTTPSTPSTPATTPVATTPAPVLPTVAYTYADATNPWPAHFYNAAAGSTVASLDNAPAAANPITDDGATLGRVLFYDKRLSANGTVSCGSCHQQRFGFSDTAQFSRGFAGGATARHSMALGNARFYQNGRFFWDERAASLEAQVLQPIQNAVEMGMTLATLTTAVAGATYYAPLFTKAFGTADVTSDRIAKALAQFVRSLTTYRARIDSTFAGPGRPASVTLTAEEEQGRTLFTGVAGCALCHGTVSQVADQARNTGLDATVTDVGSGNGAFKVPSLRNVALRGRYMHDGRFTSLEQVIDFYNAGVQANPFLDQRLRTPNGQPRRLNLTLADRQALVAFLRTLTDANFISDPRFSNPFPAP